MVYSLLAPPLKSGYSLSGSYDHLKVFLSKELDKLKTSSLNCRKATFTYVANEYEYYMTEI